MEHTKKTLKFTELESAFSLQHLQQTTTLLPRCKAPVQRNARNSIHDIRHDIARVKYCWSDVHYGRTLWTLCCIYELDINNQ